MATISIRPGKVLLWGAITALLYGGLFYYAEDVMRMAHETANTCISQEAGRTIYFAKATPELCAARGGQYVSGNWLFMLVPIVIAFVLSYTHGLFTGLFWDAIGLRPANSKE